MQSVIILDFEDIKMFVAEGDAVGEIALQGYDAVADDNSWKRMLSSSSLFNLQ
jgi:hypothetical protein